jgi:dihydroorotase
MSTILIKNAIIVNENTQKKGSVLIQNNVIQTVFDANATLPEADQTIDADGALLIPGVIDDQVHFREPGLIHKADISSESRAAVAGGVTSYMEMPNTNPQTTTQDALKAKFDLAAEKSVANYSFYLGATNDNISEIAKTDPKNVCGIKVFMGSSTGNMLVDKDISLSRIFSESPVLVATHCEDESTIQQNLSNYKQKYGEHMPFKYHPEIRSDEACYKSSSKAVELATKYGTKLHVLHLSSAREISLFSNETPLADKKITGEVCVHHLWFTADDYDTYGSSIKWNPSVKYKNDRNALREALINNKLDVVATDHAPHTKEEKKNSYFSAPSGGPLVQHSLVAMLEMVKKGIFTYEMVVDKMCHAPANLFQIEKRGFINPGFFADLVIILPNSKWEVSPNNILYKCGWSPFEKESFNHRVTHTFVNGELVYKDGVIYDQVKGLPLKFDR